MDELSERQVDVEVETQDAGTTALQATESVAIGTDMGPVLQQALGADPDADESAPDEGEKVESGSSEPAGKINLNTATSEELQTIPGIGPSLAQRILRYREEAEAFLSKDELLAIPGIGPVLYDQISEWLTVVPPGAAVGFEAALEESMALDEAQGPRAAAEPRRPAPQPAPRATPQPQEDRGRSWAWLWSALLGGILGIAGTLIILAALNGALTLGQTPVVLDINSRVEGLRMDLDAVGSDLTDAQRRLAQLEGLPARMDDVEETVTQLSSTVRDLSDRVGDLQQTVDTLVQRTDALTGRVDATEENIDTLTTRADRVDGFFGQLQSLLTEVFGAGSGPSE